MRIEPNDKPIELSYLDLLRSLIGDIKKDSTIPISVKNKTLKNLDNIYIDIYPYSY